MPLLKHAKAFVVTIALTAAMTATGAALSEPAIIPVPVEVRPMQGQYVVGKATVLCISNPASKATSDYLRGLVKTLRGLDLKTGTCPKSGGIRLDLDSKATVDAPEGYSLSVTSKGVNVRARTQTGLFYGVVTLSQLLSPDDKYSNPVTLSGVAIKDYPRYAWRGLMIDPARHFLPVADVKIMIDQMAQHKLNSLHMHLSDDQGWRLEIKRYPKLTEIGAWRTPPSNGGPGSPTGAYGGFYTQDDIRDLVAYAKARHITIVPEIDMPGHAQAVIAAYPEIGVTGNRPEVSPDWGVNPYLFNTNDKSLEFIRNVLDEVMGLFPSTFIHVGGDEAIKDQWKASAEVQAHIKTLGLKDEHELQTWFIDQIGAYLNSKGRRLIGWDEILEGGIPKSSTIMSWRGYAGAIQAARNGNDVVLSPTYPLYFDNMQSRRNDEPSARGWVVTLNNVYGFDATPNVLTLDESRHVLGAQANLWSEYLMSGGYVQNAAFPRAAALSETIWSPPSRRNWEGFLSRLPAQMERYKRQGIAAADLAFAVDFALADGRNAALASGSGNVTLVNQVEYGVIHYTLDAKTPTQASPVYKGPLKLTFGQSVTAVAFSPEGLRLAEPRTYTFTAETLLTRPSQELLACKGDLGLRAPLTADSPAKAPVYNINIFDSCWIYPEVRREGVKSISVDMARLARNYGLASEQVKVVSHPKQTPFGELVIYRDSCTGPEEARLPLPDPATSPNQATMSASLPPVTGAHALCLLFTAPIDGPYYAIDAVKLKLK